MEFIREAFDYELLPSLGLTEGMAGITVARPEDPPEAKLHTIGCFMDHLEGRIADVQTGKPLPAGEMGEILVRGYCVMQGYYHLPEATAAAIDTEGFLHTGDLGFLDKNGFLHYTGRCKQIITRGGENIHPGEIEACMLQDPRIQDVCVIGVPDEHYGEVICACVVKAPQAELTQEEVRQMVSTHLAYYKVPQYVQFWQELPLSGSGKKLLQQLQQEAVRRLAE